jgi:lysozyme family protein
MVSHAIADPVDRWANWVIRAEGRFDERDRLVVYPLPPGDGGGSYEVAGINDRYHPLKAARLRSLIERGQHTRAELEAREYIVEYTQAAGAWHPDRRVQAYLHDCHFNRGRKGAVIILQIALQTAGRYAGPLDGIPGRGTLSGAARLPAEDLIPRLTLARQTYERLHVGRDESSKFWSGLTNRWISCLQLCLPPST